MISSLELARLCGVSQGTVDRALHGRAGISAATRARVLEVAAKHGYKPNPTVRTLLHGESEVVGAVFPQSRGVFFVDLLEAVRAAFAERGLLLYSTSASDDAGLVAAIEDMAARRMRGVVVVPPGEGVELPEYLALPMASLLSPIRAKNQRLIAPDEVETGRRATNYLLGKGHRAILHLTYGRPARAIDQRLEGYESTMRAQRLPARIVLESDELVARVRAERATALFCHNDWLALRAIRALEAAGLRVPADISVLGVDDTPTFHELFPGLTTLGYPLAAVADAAARWLAHGGVPPSVPPLEVVERETVRALTEA